MAGTTRIIRIEHVGARLQHPTLLSQGAKAVPAPALRGARSAFSLDWSQVRPRNVQPLVDAFESLAEDIQARMQANSSRSPPLATPAGKVQILDEATFHGKQQQVACRVRAPEWLL